MEDSAISQPVEIPNLIGTQNFRFDLAPGPGVAGGFSVVNETTACAAAVVTTVSVLVKVVATAKEFVVAGTFGRSDAMDAFLMHSGAATFL